MVSPSKGTALAPWASGSAERHERLVHTCSSRPTLPACRGIVEPRAARSSEVSVREHGERLAEPAVAAGACRAEKELAAADQLDVRRGRVAEQVLDLRSPDAVRRV